MMTKTVETVQEVIRNPKHPFRRTEDQPGKPQKSRYERRKIKEFLRSCDWLAQEG